MLSIGRTWNSQIHHYNKENRSAMLFHSWNVRIPKFASRQIQISPSFVPAQNGIIICRVQTIAASSCWMYYYIYVWQEKGNSLTSMITIKQKIFCPSPPSYAIHTIWDSSFNFFFPVLISIRLKSNQAIHTIGAVAFYACQENNDNNPVPYCFTHANTLSHSTSQKVANLCKKKKKTKVLNALIPTEDSPKWIATSWCAEWIFLFPFRHRLCSTIEESNWNAKNNLNNGISESFAHSLSLACRLSISRSHFTHEKYKINK